MVGMELIIINIKKLKIMKLQELTTDELMNIEGGGFGNFIYDFLYFVTRGIHNAVEMSDALKQNPNYGNAMVYK
jgi:bacteriocin-like protein